MLQFSELSHHIYYIETESVLNFSEPVWNIPNPELLTPRKMLGFTSVSSPPNGKLSERGHGPAKFNHINSIVLKSDLLGNGISVNNQSSGALANILITAHPNSQIVYQPFNPNLVDASELVSHSKSYITFSIQDITGRSINTNTEFYNFCLVLKYDLYPRQTNQSADYNHPRFA